MAIIDISPLLHPEIAVWPGDVGLRRHVALSIAGGHNIDLSSLTTTVHVGAHCDAPSHYQLGGRCIAEVPLEAYWGPCFVAWVTVSRGGLIEPQHCQGAVELGANRVLFRTGTYPDAQTFNEDFAAFSPTALEYLGCHGVVLVGIDTPSVDPFSSKDLPAHQMLFRFGMVNLEGLVLEDAPQGFYELVALPLRLKDFDGSPVRAALRKI